MWEGCDLKKLLINLVKKNHFVYIVYYIVYSIMLKILAIFIRPNKKQILFVSNGGKKYSCNVKPIYERMLGDERFSEWNFVWAFRNPQKFELPDSNRTKKCKIDSLSYYRYVLNSMCWITNVSIERGLSLKRQGNFYVNTWHGFPIKHLGRDVVQGPTFKTKKVEVIDLMLTEGLLDKRSLNSAFSIKKTVATGYPRNDKLFCDSENIKDKVKSRYKIPVDKKVILYAPTYRDYDKDQYGNFSCDIMISYDKFCNRLGDKYILLLRTHPAVTKKELNNFHCLDVSDYPYVEDLLLVADILVTDYSGIMADFSLLEKPVICYMYDYELYQQKRGIYEFVLDSIPFEKCRTEEELYEIIKNIDYKEACKLSKEFKTTCGLLGAGATERAVDAIAIELGL